MTHAAAVAKRAVDVVIPTYNAAELVAACLVRLDDPVVADRIVVDDVSEQDVAEILGDAARVIRLDSHRGLAHALNTGAAAGGAPMVLFLNNDILASPGAVARLAEVLEADPAAASAGGRLVDPGSLRTQASYLPRDLPGAASLIARIAGLERLWPANPLTGGHLRRPLPQAGVSRTTRQPAGACLLVRRSALEAVGGWDERYWFWYEDVDLSRRLLAQGPALYVPEAVFEHVGRHSTRAWGKPEQHRRLYHGTLRYAQSHVPEPGRSIVALIMALVCLLRALIHVRRRPRAADVYAALVRECANVLRGVPLEPPLERPEPV